MSAVYRLRVHRTVTQSTDFEILAESAAEAAAAAHKGMPHVAEDAWTTRLVGPPAMECVGEVIPE